MLDLFKARSTFDLVSPDRQFLNAGIKEDKGTAREKISVKPSEIIVLNEDEILISEAGKSEQFCVRGNVSHESLRLLEDCAGSPEKYLRGDAEKIELLRVVRSGMVEFYPMNHAYLDEVGYVKSIYSILELKHTREVLSLEFLQDCVLVEFDEPRQTVEFNADMTDRESVDILLKGKDALSQGNRLFLMMSLLSVPTIDDVESVVFYRVKDSMSVAPKIPGEVRHF